ncbi:GNAT family N-acetyltransferase [Labedaea rhizosphaerae]|uniref:GNAT family N-acetyltransferase n=1 Tax=Labedaea rhizosphaerae TaxID=598644 RepID=UPI001414F4E4|nr:GNAT family N-acetyltransferase [Labedaea rhizosphaerae]
MEFDPFTAAEKDLREIFDVASAAHAVDLPDLPPVTFEAVIGGLRTPQPNLAPARRWFARRDGRIVALASLFLPPAENSALSLVKLLVHPDVRRHGVGTAVFHRISPALRDEGRTVVEAWNVRKGSPGERFGSALGFRVVCSTLFQVLSLDGLGPVPDVPPAKGYRLRSWSRSAPDDLVDSYASARQAIADSPFGQSAFRFPDWNARRVRADEEDRRRTNIEQRIVAAVHEESGVVAGFTELNLPAHHQDVAFQGDTAVLAEHRGHGLGYCLKTSMLRWLRAEHPGHQQVYTSTASANAHMAGINHRLGFRDFQETLVLAQDVAFCDTSRA